MRRDDRIVLGGYAPCEVAMMIPGVESKLVTIIMFIFEFGYSRAGLVVKRREEFGVEVRYRTFLA